MKRFSNFLLVVDEGTDPTQAAQRARTLAKNNQAALTVCAVVDAIPEGLELVENFDYYDGVRFFKGSLDEDDLLSRAGLNATFGVAMVHLIESRNDVAEQMLQQLVAGSSQGYWPAETELLQLRH